MTPTRKYDAGQPPDTKAPASGPAIPPARSSGARRVAPYIELRTILLRYLSPILVDTVLDKAMFSRGLSAATLTVSKRNELAPDIMLGLRLFVEAKRLPDLMLELAEIIEMRDP
jgi:hypothetical protein